MDIISNHEFNAICQDGNTKVIKFGKVDQPKVFEKNGNTIIKLFYPKKSKLSSDRIWPRAMRFYRNVKKLHERGYNAPIVSKIQFCPESKMYLMYYPKIAGSDVRYLANNNQLHIIKHVAHLMADLHDKGVFFRCIHLENLLYQTNGEFALLDVTDVRFKKKPLNLYARYRNLKHLFQEPLDKNTWQAFGVKEFMHEYFKAVKLSKYSCKVLTHLIMRSLHS